MSGFKLSFNRGMFGFVAIGALLVSVTGEVQAVTSDANLSVSSSVSANCVISTSPVAFGAYDPISANAISDLDGSGTVTVACTNGSSAAITLGQGGTLDVLSTDAAPLRQLSDGAGNILSYALFQDSSRLTSWANTLGTSVAHLGDGTSTGISVYGRMPSGQNVPAGSYSDTVVATVTF